MDFKKITELAIGVALGTILAGIISTMLPKKDGYDLDSFDMD